MSYTIDSSVWVATLLKEEPSHQAAFELVNQLIEKEETIVIPVTVYIEVVLAVARRTDEGDLPERAAQFLREIPTLQFVEIDYGRMDMIVLRTKPLRLRGMDAVVVGVAAEFETTLITLDQELANRANSMVFVQRL